MKRAGINRGIAKAAMVALLAIAATSPGPAAAAAGTFTGEGLSLLWGVPFAGLLLSLALWPLFSAEFWHRHYGKITLAWALVFLVPFAVAFGLSETVHQVVHEVVLEYLPFVILLFSLYTIAGGIAVRGTLHGTPTLNTGLLALGSLLASIMGTTGAAMLLVRPLLRANEARRRKVHIVVFFIILVGNIGGALSPLGDPPLFIGFLKGVDFFWTTRVLALPTLALVGALLAIFYVLDRHFWRSEDAAPRRLRRSVSMAHSTSRSSPAWSARCCREYGSQARIPSPTPSNCRIGRDVVLFALALLSVADAAPGARSQRLQLGTDCGSRQAFAGIFPTIIPVIAMLRAGGSARGRRRSGHRQRDRSATPDNVFDTDCCPHFDNAPTYLVFSTSPAATLRR
jgi:hypothetical protein